MQNSVGKTAFLSLGLLLLVACGKPAESVAPAKQVVNVAVVQDGNTVSSAVSVKPAASVDDAVITSAAAPVVAVADSTVGAALYQRNCFACHDTAVAGAPRRGDKAAWAPRLAKGKDALHASAIRGLNAMPAKGGSGAPDADVMAAVDYMLATVQ